MDKENIVVIRVFLGFLGMGSLISAYYIVLQFESIWSIVFCLINAIAGFALATIAAAPKLDNIIIE